MTALPSIVVLINGFGLLFVILNTFALGLRIPFGRHLAWAAAHWQLAVWALVINFILIPLLFIGYLLTVAAAIPGQIKVGFCVAALSGGMPFAPLLAKVAKANVGVATILLVALTVVTIIVLPLGLPLAVAAVDAQLKVSVWDVAWPLLLFLLLPLVLGNVFRVWWPDLAPPVRRWVVPFAVLCLLLNINFTLYGFWNLFVQTWGTRSYLAAVAGPFIGLGCGYLLVSILRVKDVGIRHATEITTAIRNIAAMLLVMIFPFGAYPLVSVSITILNSIGIVVVLVFALAWRRALASSSARATTQQAPPREPSPETAQGTTTMATD
jgi:BASS family bile acid:Na+ symporter